MKAKVFLNKWMTCLLIQIIAYSSVVIKSQFLILRDSQKRFLIYIALAMFSFLSFISNVAPLYAQDDSSSLVNIHRLWNADWFDHFYTTNRGEAQNAKDNLGFTHQGLLGKCYPEPREGTIPLYRLYHTVNGKPNHFYTTSEDEKDMALNHNYRLEGITCWVPEKRQASLIDRWFKLREEGRDWSDIVKVERDWKIEGRRIDRLVRPSAADIAEMLNRNKRVPVYRLFKDGPDHFYTTSWDEVAEFQGRNWSYHGIVFYVYPADECPKDCSPGSATCRGNNPRRCVEDENFCTTWRDYPACSERCFEGSCMPACDHACSQINDKACVSGDVKRCVNNNIGCRVWQQVENCSDGCRNAQCLKKTCNGAIANDNAQGYTVITQAPNGCGGNYTGFANNLSEAKTCAQNDGWQVVGQLCEYLVQVEPGYETMVVSSSRNSALMCVRNTVCSNCSLQVIGEGQCITQQ